MKNITFLGDSLTAGYGLPNPATQSVPALIQQKIRDKNLEYQVFNGGMSGSTSGNALYRLDHWLKRPVDVFVLQIGINDLIRKTPVELTAKNMEDIFRKVTGKYPECKLGLLGMRLPKTTSSSVVASFNGIYPALAEKLNLAYIPFYLEGVAGRRELNLPDGLHPNASGYSVIADRIWPVIKTLL